MNIDNILVIENFLTDEEFKGFIKVISFQSKMFKEQDIGYADYFRFYTNDHSCYYIDKIMHHKVFNLKDLVKDKQDLAWIYYRSSHSKYMETQITSYRSGGKYRWHTDHYRQNVTTTHNYILYMTDDFEGGELQISSNLYPHTILATERRDIFPVGHTFKPKKNMFVMMPSYYTHRVTEVISGKEHRLTVNGHLGYKPVT